VRVVLSHECGVTASSDSAATGRSTFTGSKRHSTHR
jgi:hypothetical protein